MSDALDYHSEGEPGKLEIKPTKPMNTQHDLSLAYSPGVAEPCLKISENPDLADKYTAKGNLVAVISNGTAVLGLGNIGALASKPVMEGKACLFKKMAGINAIDIEVSTEDPEEFINCVKNISQTFGGINLEDIKAPDCFTIEKKLREEVDIPVFHDDQHGTAIIALAALINAAHLTDREFKDMKVVVSGAGAAAVACIELIKSYGVPNDNVILCDTVGVVYKGRKERMNEWKEAHAVDTDMRTISDAIRGADVFLGLSVKGIVTKDMVKSMNRNPIIFAMANPDPEILPSEVKEVRNDAIVATGRSDFNNQVNNVMGFPYIFRGALDVKATVINDEMKIAAARSLAALAREHVPAEVSAAYSGRKLEYGPEYIIPVPFDPRLIYTIPPAVANAAMVSKVARHPIDDMQGYKQQLMARLDPTVTSMNLVFKKIASSPCDIIFAEGEEEDAIRTALNWQEAGYGAPILVGREAKIKEKLAKMGAASNVQLKIVNAANSIHTDKYIEYLYNKNKRKGMLHRDAVRLVKNERNIFAAAMLACGDGDALITGLTRGYMTSFNEVRKAIGRKPGRRVFGMSILITGGKTIFISDTTIHEMPTAEDLADIAIQTAEVVEDMGHTPRIAFLSFTNFGDISKTDKPLRIREAISILDKKKVGFEYDGEMCADVALNPSLMKLYPFCKLSGPANVLIMPALHSANIASKLLQELGGGSLIGPVISGLEKPVQIMRMGSTSSDIYSMAAFAASEAINNKSAIKILEEESVEP